MLKRLIRIVGGEPGKREINEYSEIVDDINALENSLEKLSDGSLREKTLLFKKRLADGETLDDILAEAFATVREASKRTIGLRHYDVQMIGGIVLYKGKIAEMRTGEGKTLVATLPIYLNALAGKGTHLITVNDYLARRDARWMAPIYHALGLSVGVLQMAARTENGKKAFLVDLSKESPHEDQHQLQLVNRKIAYSADITYGTNSEFGFDYLRDNMTLNLDERVQRGHFFAIIDEVDNVLIDEARTPLIISGPAQDESPWYLKMSQIVRQLRPDDIEADEKTRTVVLTELGEMHVEELLGTPLRDPDRPEDLTPDQARTLGYLEQALRAQYLYKKNKDYLVQAGKVIIVDEFTGRLMPGRRWSEGLHQAIEAKEGVKVEPESVTYATITIQNYFRMYQKLAGMTGTAVTESEEFNKIYKLDAIAIPTNLEYIALRPDSDLVSMEGQEGKYKYTFYARKDDPNKTPVFWRRKDYPDIVYRSFEMKIRSITQEILRNHVIGRPVLVGTTSVDLSEKVSQRLRAEQLRKMCLTMVLRSQWLKSHNREEDGRQISELQFLYKPIEELDISEMRKLAKDENIVFNPEDPSNISILEQLLSLNDYDRIRLTNVLKGGIPHEVLNAKKHTEESQIIAGAGAFGAVTIATNMAGRGVDIKLGGELAEEIVSEVNRVLRKAGHANAFDMTMEERQKALLDMDPEEYGIYEAEVNYFLQHLADMKHVRDLGGLHVIGSERHEARRIDNQLRGRSARQGDPGSSKFYLSMEDELMRLFGGGQADSLMQRLKIDDAVPLEANMVGRIVEQSQNRVEGANFDLRKHLLEYDDVLNNQRNRIYLQRDLIFTKDDLSEDVREMLVLEIGGRVKQTLNNQEGPWQLLAWLSDIQPSIITADIFFPSFANNVLLETIFNSKQSILKDEALSGLIEIVDNSLKHEDEHILNSLEELLENTRQRLENQISDKLELVDLFIEGIDEDDNEYKNRPGLLASTLQSNLGIPLRLSSEQQKLLLEGSDIRQEIINQISYALTGKAINSLIGAIERRLDDSLGIQSSSLTADNWDDACEALVGSVRLYLEQRRERYLGNGNPGILIKEIETLLAKHDEFINKKEFLKFLVDISHGSRTVFHRKTHQRFFIQTRRINYFYYAAQLVSTHSTDEIEEMVLNHLENALDAIKLAWGLNEWIRISSVSISELDENTVLHISRVLPADRINTLLTLSLTNCSDDERTKIVAELGRQIITEVYRKLILNVLSQQWVDYLTEMESLRVSIGLEAYAQRDPLVQYKNRAYELFQDLLSNVRLGVINRMFRFQPQMVNGISASTSRVDTVPSEPPSKPAPELPRTINQTEKVAKQPESKTRSGGSKAKSKSQKRRRGRR
jgi:preprotein translocase subunit SecA